MKQVNKEQAGFSAAELLITLFIGAVFLIAGTQLYITVLGQSVHGDNQAVASTASLAHMNRIIHNVELYPTECSSLPSSSTENYAYGPYSSLQLQVNTSCPNASSFPTLRKLTVKGTNEGVSASHATYYIEP